MAARQTDQASVIFVREREKLISIACRVVESRAVAEELVQDSWLRWQEKNYAAKDALPIFRQIVSNLALDWHRRRRFERGLLADQFFAEEEMPSSERVLAARQDLRVIVAALSELPKRHVTAFRMHMVDGYTYKEIGHRLGISLTRSYELVEDTLVHLTIRMRR